MLRRAMCHRSWCAEVAGEASNERLEFLGDAVLGWVVADIAYRRHQDLPEGKLTDLRKSVVNASALAEISLSVDIGSCLLLGKGESQAGGRTKLSILADALEAVFGAVYLDRGLAVATELIERLFRPRMEAYVRGEGERDYKTILQELASQELHSMPEYRIEERGPDHEKEFTATVYLGGEPMGAGIGRSKKEAEQQAAHEAHERLTGRLADTGS